MKLLPSIMLSLISLVAFADSYTTYNPSWAAIYATQNYNKAYGNSSNQNPFEDYDYLPNGGNCTNFISQCIIAGMVSSSNPHFIYSKRKDFDIDRSSSSYYEWYFWNDGDRGPAWTGAHKLFEYAKYNLLHYKGLHFEYVTHDTQSSYMDYTKVRVGDIIFVDWQDDGNFDHSMIVTRFEGWRLGYNEIRVTYQSNNVLNRGLGDLNEENHYNAVFHVYRPVNYNPNGL